MNKNPSPKKRSIVHFNSTGNRHNKRLFNRLNILLLLTMTIAISLTVVGIGVYSIAISREYVSQNAKTQSRNLAQFTNQNISYAFKRIDHSLLTVTRQLEHDLAYGKIDRDFIKSLAFDEKSLLDEVDIRIADADGRFILDNFQGDSSAGFADTSYFRHFRDHADVEMFITKPIFTNKWTIISARRYNFPDGRFAGVVTAFVSLEFFQKALSGYDVGRSGMLTLRYNDGSFVVRQPAVVKGKTLPVNDRTFSAELGKIIKSGVSEKIFTAIAPFDKTKRILTFKRIEGAPFFVVASLAEEDYLIQWYKDRIMLFAIIAVFLAGLWTLVLLLWFSGKLRLQAEEKKYESEGKFRTVFENSSVGKSITGLDGSLNVNQALCNMLGYSKEELSGFTWHNITHPDDMELTKATLDQLVCGEKQTARLTKRYLKKDGSPIWTDVNVTLQKNSRGKPLYYITTIIDITDRKNAEDLVAAEKERLLVTLRSIGDAVIATDIQGKISLMNKVAENLTGWTIDEVKGKPLTIVFNIINELTRQPVENPVKKVLSSGEIIELENHTLLISRDGSERIISDCGAPIKNQENKTIGVVLVFRDMTEKQKLLETAQNLQKLQSIGILAGGIAHDFNNLLGGIYGLLDLAQTDPDKNKSSHHISKAIATIDRARALTTQLLTFAKGGAPVRKIGSLFPFIKETALFALSGSSVSCRFDVDENLWACNFDKNQIGQVIDNLFINAVQAMPLGGGIELTASNVVLSEKEIHALPRGDYVKISVTDHGIGMAKELLPRIFDPFFTTKTHGHGLGLATCFSIINKHGGCIEVESEPGKGSTFNVYLPASAEPIPSSSQEKEKKHIGSGTFLVMDDEEVIRETIGSMLISFGYDVACKDNGKDAIDFFAAEIKAGRKLSGIILDLTVPGSIGGKEAVAEIRKIDRNIPVFVASGYAEDLVMKNPAEYGFTASICKPFRISELQDILNKYLGDNLNTL